MAVRVNQSGYDHAKKLVHDGQAVLDERDDWSEHQPSAAEQNEYLSEHGYRAYGRWFLAIDDEQSPETKGHYKFPYGDFERVHRCAVLSAESRAGQYKHHEVELAAAHLHGMLDEIRAAH